MPLTIVTYHYVRDLRHSRYPGIKGRDLADFKGQLDHFARHYEVVTTEAVIAACQGQAPLPDNALWLTFDDGYLDHFANVFPLLFERKMHGAFFPPVNAIRYGELLDVNKAHFIRAAQPDSGPVIDAIRQFVEARQGDQDLEPFDDYWQLHAKQGRYDGPKAMFIKRMLQTALPDEPRQTLIDDLFARFVSVDQQAFARELYATEDQLRMMLQCGMYIGGHGARHYWFDRLDAEQQRIEVDTGLQFLADLGAPTTDWVICYPHGSYDDKLLQLLRNRDCAVGLTIEDGIAEPGRDEPLLLTRRDTNELPIA